MKIIINIVATLIIIIAYAIPFLLGGIYHLKDRYYDKKGAIIEIFLGIIFFSWPLFMQALMRWEI